MIVTKTILILLINKFNIKHGQTLLILRVETILQIGKFWKEFSFKDINDILCIVFHLCVLDHGNCNVSTPEEDIPRARPIFGV